MYKVLIADDEMIIRNGIKSFVEAEEGFTVYAMCEDGQEALTVATEEAPDVCFVDINMPFVNGLDFIERLQKICPEAMVVIVTGYDDFAYAQRALTLRVRDYLLKPVKEDEFRVTLQKLRAVLDEKRRNQRILNWCRENFDEMEHIEQNKVSYSGNTQTVLKYLQENYSDSGLSLNGIAEQLHVSAPYLSKIFREETGDNFQNYLQRIRIKKATELLQDESLLIYDIAEQCGYSSQHYFSAAFKKEVGMSPAEYRKGNVKKD